MPPAVATHHHPLPFLIRSLSSGDDAKRSITISFGLLLGVGALAFILVVFCCVRQSRQSYQEHLFGGERDAVSVEILRGAEDMPYLKGFRSGDRARGCCGLFYMGRCGVANESAVTVERRGSDVVLCAGPRGDYGSGPGRGSHRPDRDHGLGGHGRGPSGRGRDASGESHRHRDNNQSPVPKPAPGYRGSSSGRGSCETPSSGSGSRGRTGSAGNVNNIITHSGRNTSTHIGIHPALLTTERPGRSAHQRPQSSRHRPHSFDGPYLGHTQGTRIPPSTLSRERGRPRSFSPVVRRQNRRRSPPRTEIEPVVSYPGAVYQGSGRRASRGPSEHEIPRPPARGVSLNPRDLCFVGAPISADLLFSGDGSSAISTVHILGQSRGESGASKADEPRTESRTGDGTPRVISVHSGDSGVKPEHLGSLVDSTVSASTYGGSVLPSPLLSGLGANSSAGAIKGSAPGTTGVLARPYQYRTPSGSTETVMYAPLAGITDCHSISSENHPSSATAFSLSTAEPITTQKSHSSSIPEPRLPGQGSATGHLPPPPSSSSRPASTYTTPPQSNPPTQPPSLPGLQQSYYTTASSGAGTRFVTAPNSIYSNIANAPGWVPAIVVVPRAACVDRRYWTTVESVSDSDE
ncbi:hypothetical protein Q9L58_001150 [Maublancomyces gigas]|uniref:Uncharacterized protein n=1 Tax=Discina gigas TaxID=1032678 RepID=A0ABR3GVB4_9PEZI